MTHDRRKGAAAAGPRSTSLRLPPQVRPVDRTHSLAGAVTDRSGVEAASLTRELDLLTWGPGGRPRWIM
jgi:hypothetical protein